MKVVLKTSEKVTLSFAKSILEQAGIRADLFDTSMDTLLGAVATPRRLMVSDEDYETACHLLREAGVEPLSGKEAEG